MFNGNARMKPFENSLVMFGHSDIPVLLCSLGLPSIQHVRFYLEVQ